MNVSDAPTVVTLGETMIRLNPPGYQTLEQAGSLEMSVGGTEANMAIALQRLGVATGWVSALPDSPLGHKVAAAIQAHGVDVSRVVWSRKGRMGLYWVETGAPPRASRIFYDRAGSAASLLDVGALDWDYILRARHLHLTGITPALSTSCRKVTESLIDRAQRAGMTVSFDVNYRAKLWSPAEARACLGELIGGVDLLISSADDIATVFGASGAPDEVAYEIQARFGLKSVVLTLGKDGALALVDTIIRAESLPVTLVDRIGAGDAFDAGLLYGYLQNDMAKGLRMAVAMAMLKHTIPGDLAWISRDQVDAVLAGDAFNIQR